MKTAKILEPYVRYINKSSDLQYSQGIQRD